MVGTHSEWRLEDWGPCSRLRSRVYEVGSGQLLGLYVQEELLRYLGKSPWARDTWWTQPEAWGREGREASMCVSAQAATAVHMGGDCRGGGETSGH